MISKTNYPEMIIQFRNYLVEQERSEHTVAKYLHDVGILMLHLNGEELTKAAVIDYKETLKQRYAPSSVNSMIAAVNTFLSFIGKPEMRVKPLKIQKSLFRPSDRELSKDDYFKLLNAAKRKGDQRLMLLIETICSTGIRVSEVKYITVQAVKNQWVEINCKGKHRIVFLTDKLCTLLRKYIKQHHISEGAIFVSKNGTPLNRSSIWRMMKGLGNIANVSGEKIFPHNLRHLFARTFYSVEKDISRLADILGHSSINTTRIYTAESGEIHAKRMEQLGLVTNLNAT